MKRITFVAAAALAISFPALQVAAADDADLIKSAESAAPAAVSSKAAIYAMGADGKMKTLREKSTNGFWCMADDPSTPGPDPMCGDANAMGWAMAWMGHTEPPKGKIGLIYMLMGGPAQSNLDPFAVKPPEGSDWIMDRPHVMIVNFGDTLSAYPEKEAKPDTTQPYVMWAGTPYAHLMVPVH